MVPVQVYRKICRGKTRVSVVGFGCRAGGELLQRKTWWEVKPLCNFEYREASLAGRSSSRDLEFCFG